MTTLRTALERCVRLLEAEAVRRRHTLFGGYTELEAEAKLLRDNLDTMVDAVDRPQSMKETA
jgi:hypothetical protein